jgi:hypothetical protein
MVEHAAVNRDVVGSSPTSGAISKTLIFKPNFREKGSKMAKVRGKVRGKTAQSLNLKEQAACKDAAN